MTDFEKKLANTPILMDLFRALEKTPPEKRLLMLDYDGTLAPFRVERDQAVPYPGVSEILDHLIAAGTSRVVIVSGRAVTDLLPLLGLSSLPEIWGSHGLEHQLPDGTYRLHSVGLAVQQFFSDVQKWAHKKGWDEACEVKPGGVAFHWRSLNEAERERMKTEILDAWSEPARQHHLELLLFDGGVEFRLPGVNKGKVVRQLLDESDGGVAVYLGDDLTDEDAFRALRGRGVGILVRRDFRPTAADVHLVPPEELLEFLHKWENTCKIFTG
ncbi:MAG: trehalose-phosphatase [Calditrichaeota bacterium]|nr:trehalose-phosphatase [Calditrichota bacterium]